MSAAADLASGGGSLRRLASRSAPVRLARLLLSQPLSATAALYIVLLIFVAIFAAEVAPFDPNAQTLTHALETPTALHWLGTDDVGRDILSQLIYGARVALRASLQSVALAIIIGLPVGLLAGYVRGWVDSAVMRITDAVQALPGLIVAFSVIAALGRGLNQAMLAVSLLFALNLIRMVRGAVFVERERLYVDAARVLGMKRAQIMFGQILPNVLAPVIVQSTIYLGSAQLIEATLSFLGLGLDRTQPSWGGMLNAATSYESIQPLMGIAPGIMLTLSILAFNLLGDTLRDALAGTSTTLPSRSVARVRSVLPADPLTPTAAAANADASFVLRVNDLAVTAQLDGGAMTELIRPLSFAVRAGTTLGLVGESGSGKTMVGMALMGLLPTNGWISGGSIRLNGREIVGLPEDRLRDLRGSEIAMVFQDPLIALSPVHTIGQQIIAPMRRHLGLSRIVARERAVDLLAMVGIAEARARLKAYPHQVSGGMAQRVMIAMALSCDPKLLIADEPTTALDVTVQGQVLDLLFKLRERTGLAILLSTHDLGVVADACDEALVMYAGELVEAAPVARLFAQPRHPYTAALLRAMPRNRLRTGRMPTIGGQVPPPWERSDTCRFANRCSYVQPRCLASPLSFTDGVRCLRAGEQDLRTG